MKTTKSKKFPAPKTVTAVLKKVAAMPHVEKVISERSAKAPWSALLELVAAELEITITSDGRPKAKLVGAVIGNPKKVFEGMGITFRNNNRFTADQRRSKLSAASGMPSLSHVSG